MCLFWSSLVKWLASFRFWITNIKTTLSFRIIFYYNFYTANDTTRVLIKSILLKKIRVGVFKQNIVFEKQFKNGQHELFNKLFTVFCSFPTTLYALMSFHSFPYFKHVNQTFFLCNFLYNELYMFIILCALNFFLKRIHNEESIMSNNQ